MALTLYNLGLCRAHLGQPQPAVRGLAWQKCATAFLGAFLGQGGCAEAGSAPRGAAARLRAPAGRCSLRVCRIEKRVEEVEMIRQTLEKGLNGTKPSDLGLEVSAGQLTK